MNPYYNTNNYNNDIKKGNKIQINAHIQIHITKRTTYTSTFIQIHINRRQINSLFKLRLKAEKHLGA